MKTKTLDSLSGISDKNVAKSILSLTHEEALDFFLRQDQYHNFELPEYIDFSELLQYVHKIIGNKRYEDCVRKKQSPENLHDVNLDILLNKDGKYAVRPLVLVNPYLYVFLVHEMCSEEGWRKIMDCFEKFRLPHIAACALPIMPRSKEPFHKSTTILNWWKSMEQRSIELSLEYRYMFISDITNCYGSVNPQAISWAFSRKGTEYETKKNDQLAGKIQNLLRTMQQGRNIGIPQGSAIFDFISEIILGYADLLLHEQIQKMGINDSYEILRYRDDYRVFCNNKDTLEQLSYILQQVLESLNFRMNSQKTKISDSIILDSLKKDKLFYLYNTPIFNKKGVDFDSFEKHLLYILMFGRQYPNGSQLKVMLSDIDKRLEKWLTYKSQLISIPLDDNEESMISEISKQRPLVGGGARAMSAICAQIAVENVGCAHYALRVLSRIIDTLKDDDPEKRDIIDKTYRKLAHQPNSKYGQLWLQNITYQYNKKVGDSPYNMRLCRLVAGDKSVLLWNNSWLKPSFTSKFPTDSIVDWELLARITPVITFREIRAYYEDAPDMSGFDDDNLVDLVDND